LIRDDYRVEDRGEGWEKVRGVTLSDDGWQSGLTLQSIAVLLLRGIHTAQYYMRGTVQHCYSGSACELTAAWEG